MSPLRIAAFWAVFFGFVLLLVHILGEVLFPFVLGAVFAYLFDPATTGLVTRGMPRWAAAGLVVGGVCLTVLGILAFAGPLIVHEAVQFVRNFPDLLGRVQGLLAPYADQVRQITGSDDLTIHDALSARAGSAAMALSTPVLASLQSGGQILIGLVSTLIVAPVVAFFLLKEWAGFTGQIRDLLPRRYEALILDLLSQIDRRLAGFIRGQILVCLVLGILYGVCLTIAGLDYGLVIGLGAGILSIIPLVGSTAGLLTGAAVAWFQSTDPAYVGLIVGIFAAGQFIEGNILTPRLVGRSAGLHPLWVLLALSAGGSLFGLTGMLLAVPMAIVISVLGGFALHLYRNSPFYAAPPPSSP